MLKEAFRYKKPIPYKYEYNVLDIKCLDKYTILLLKDIPKDKQENEGDYF